VTFTSSCCGADVLADLNDYREGHQPVMQSLEEARRVVAEFVTGVYCSECLAFQPLAETEDDRSG
jgi:hypothetical protein